MFGLPSINANNVNTVTELSAISQELLPRTVGNEALTEPPVPQLVYFIAPAIVLGWYNLVSDCLVCNDFRKDGITPLFVATAVALGLVCTSNFIAVTRYQPSWLAIKPTNLRAAISISSLGSPEVIEMLIRLNKERPPLALRIAIGSGTVL